MKKEKSLVGLSELTTSQKVFAAFEELKEAVQEVIYEVSNNKDKEESIEELQDIVNQINEEIRYFDEEDYHGSLRKYEELRNEVYNIMDDY